MHHSSQQPLTQELTRLKQIQKSNSHVNNLIQNAKKMIYSQVTDNQKEVLEIKISIEKDHLKRTFYKIDCPDQDFTVQIVRKCLQKDQNQNNFMPKQDTAKTNKPNSISQKLMIQRQKFNQGKKESTFQPSKTYQTQAEYVFGEQQPTQQPDTKITISRYVQQKQNQIYDLKQRQSVQIRENSDKDQYQIDVSRGNSHDMVYIKPSRNRTVIVNTKIQPFNEVEEPKEITKSYFVHKQKYSEQKDQYTPTFSTYRKNRQESLNHQLSQSKYLSGSPSQYYQEQISIKTPNKELQIISTQTEEKLFMQTMNLDKNSNKKRSPKTELLNFGNINNQSPKNDHSSYEHYRSKEKLKDSEPSTSYKEILQKNKSRLQSSREKLTPLHMHTTPQSKKSVKYELHIDQLLRKKSESKKRLYGPSFESSPKTGQSSLASTTKKYSISNSQKIGSKLMDSRRNGTNHKEKSRQSRSGSKNFNSSSLSKSKKNPLHSTTLKSYHAPCSTCSKCKSSFSSPKQSKQAFSSFYLAKKYLTEQGEQECYNFLRSQGIPEQDWPTFITEYIYRQLSKAYQQATPRQSQEI